MIGLQCSMGTYNLILEDSLNYINKSYGQVYKCVDQNGTKHLLRTLTLDQSNEFMINYYKTECNAIVNQYNLLGGA